LSNPYALNASASPTVFLCGITEIASEGFAVGMNGLILRHSNWA
jgi:hypothetical protein